MTGIYPNATLTIDTIAADGEWARAIARGCLNGSALSPIADLNVPGLSRLDGSDQHASNEQPERLRQHPIEFNGVRHPHCQYE